MAISVQPLTLFSSLKAVRDTDADATVEANVNAGAATIYIIVVDNTANAAQKVYLRLWNVLAPTNGTTDPDIIVMVPAGVSRTVYLMEGMSFATGLSFACVTQAGTAGATSPTSDVPVTLYIV